MKKDAQNRVHSLCKEINKHRHLYHTEDAPEIADAAYDALKEELANLEAEFPELKTATSPTNRVGAEPLAEFTRVQHDIQQYSFDNIFDEKELVDWRDKIGRFSEKAGFDAGSLDLAAELKIDGLKVILTYEGGKLTQAATRGDGEVGEDVTQNVKTISTIPLDLFADVDAVITGEVWLSETEFERINDNRRKQDEPEFANPRNAAAGSIRQLDPKVPAERNLDFFAYRIERVAGQKAPKSHSGELKLLDEWHFKTNPHLLLTENITDIQTFYDEWIEKKEASDYGIDGVVIQIDDKNMQDAIGYTASAPRFAIAYKFPAETTTTTIEDIELQVGRTGAITPVAHLKPVSLDRTTVARATLHNEDEINRLDVRVGDTVIIKKAGDIIPQVVEVLKDLRPEDSQPFVYPDRVNGCGGNGEIYRPDGEVKHRCRVAGTWQRREELIHFASKQCFDIDGLGEKIIDQLLEAELITGAADIFELEKDELLELERFAEKSADNLLEAIDDSREITLPRFLHSLSINFVGAETARLIANNFETFEDIETASQEQLESIDGIGPKVAKSVASWFAADDNQVLARNLLAYVTVKNHNSADKTNTALSGKTFVFTGSLEKFTRSEAQAAVRDRGSSATSSVSSNTDYLVAGENPGSKKAQAEDLDVIILDETDFLNLLQNE